MPTDTPTPGPTATPVPGANWYWDLQTNAALTAGAVWAVLILVVAVVMFRQEQRVLLTMLIMVLVTLPLSIINASAWVVTLYTFMALFMLLHRLGMLGG